MMFMRKVFENGKCTDEENISRVLEELALVVQSRKPRAAAKGVYV